MNIQANRRRGASLVEIIVAVAVLGVGLYAIAASIQATRAGTAVTVRSLKAQSVASSVIEMLQAEREELTRQLAHTPRIQIPQEGTRSWGGDGKYVWKAVVERGIEPSFARIEVSVYSAQKPSPQTLAVSTSLLPLGAGGEQ